MRRPATSVRTRLGRFLRDSSATTAAEFALVVPVFLLLIFGTISVGIAFSAVIQMHFAAEKTARCLAVDVAGNCPDADTYAKSLYNGPGLTDLTFTPSASACGKQVVASGSYQFITGFQSTALNLSATACYPLI